MSSPRTIIITAAGSRLCVPVLVLGSMLGVTHDGRAQQQDRNEQAESAHDEPISNAAEVSRLESPDAGALIRRGLTRESQGELEKAIRDYTEAIRLDPSNADAYLLRAWTRLSRHENGNAIADFSEAIQLGRRDANVYIGRASAWASKRETEKAIADLSKAILLDPNCAVAYSQRGHTWLTKGAYDEAIADFNEAIRLNRLDDFAYLNRSKAWQAMGEHQKARDDFDQALRLDPRAAMADRLPYTSPVSAENALVGPGFRSFGGGTGVLVAPLTSESTGTLTPVANGEFPGGISRLVIRSGAYDRDYNACGLDFLLKRNFDKAIDEFNLAIRVGSGNAETYCNRANAYRGKKMYPEALADYDTVVGLEPGYLYALTSRAWIRATCPDSTCRDGAKAVESATKACELWDWKDARSVGILAAACAEASDFDGAVKWQTKAIDLLKDEAEAKEYRSRLTLYKERHPYRDAAP
jgi:tetratricopeptide (TPR) repeat protein